MQKLRLTELRKSLKMTQQKLADEIGVKNYTIANWEQNRTEPSIQDLIDLANFFEVSVDYLIGREDDLGRIVFLKNLSSEQQWLLSSFDSLSPERKEYLSKLIADLKELDGK